MVNNSSIGQAVVGKASGAKPRKKRSVASRAGINGRREIDRELVFKTVTEQDPRRSRGTSPNSRLNRPRTMRTASSHSQTMEITMQPVYVGIDVGKDSLHVATCPDFIKTCLPNTADGHRQLCELLKKHTIALIVLEATGGYERPVTAELLAESLLPSSSIPGK